MWVVCSPLSHPFRTLLNLNSQHCKVTFIEVSLTIYSIFFLYFPGWRDSLLSLPKKWLSTTEATDEHGFPEVSLKELFSGTYEPLCITHALSEIETFSM